MTLFESFKSKKIRLRYDFWFLIMNFLFLKNLAPPPHLNHVSAPVGEGYKEGSPPPLQGVRGFEGRVKKVLPPPGIKGGVQKVLTPPQGLRGV